MLRFIGLATAALAMLSGDGDSQKATLFLRTYPVGDLAVWKQTDGEEEFSPAILIDLIETIEPDSWMSSGKGDGELQSLPQNKSIVVAQTAEIHDRIGEMLEKMRAQERHEKAVESWRNTRNRITRIYAVSDLVVPWPLEKKGEPDFDSLVDLIKTTTDGGTWQGDCEITVDESRFLLLVTHAKAVHSEIDTLLGQLRDCQDKYATRIEAGKCGHCGLGAAPKSGEFCEKCRIKRCDPFTSSSVKE